jgi:enolase
VSSAIARVFAWEALDSRGSPTVACEVVLDDGAVGAAIVPSGASTGAHEARELRDGGGRYGGKGTRSAVANAMGVLGDAVAGVDACDQATVDARLRAADGTPDLGAVGANAVLAVSVATAVAAARSRGLALWQHVGDGAPLVPMPMVNVISGGAHAGRSVDVQDFLVVPVGATSFAQAIEWAWRARRGTAEVMEEAGHPVALVADEGGLSAPFSSNRAALEALAAGIERAGLRLGDEAVIALDVAATQLLDDAGGYGLGSEGRVVSADEWVDELAGWCRQFPIASIEDAVAEDDWVGWKAASARLPVAQNLGDDLFVTDAARLARGISEGVANAVLVKPNQTGTLSDALQVVRMAHGAGYATVLSARSGETEDSWLADLAVGWRTGQIKVGSTTRSERTAKWNRLLRIEAEVGEESFAGAQHLRPAPPS